MALPAYVRRQRARAKSISKSLTTYAQALLIGAVIKPFLGEGGHADWGISVLMIAAGFVLHGASLYIEPTPAAGESDDD